MGVTEDYLLRKPIPSLNVSVNEQKYPSLNWVRICYSGVSIISCLCNVPGRIEWTQLLSTWIFQIPASSSQVPAMSYLLSASFILWRHGYFGHSPLNRSYLVAFILNVMLNIESSTNVVCGSMRRASYRRLVLEEISKNMLCSPLFIWQMKKGIEVSFSESHCKYPLLWCQ